jgi:hypothetical protein
MDLAIRFIHVLDEQREEHGELLPIDAILSRNFSEWFTLVNAMKNGRPLRKGYFPVWV